MSLRDKGRGQRLADRAAQSAARMADQAERRREDDQRRAQTVATEVAHQRATALVRATRRY